MIGIKDQYFGTEIEMTGITRQRAAEVVAEMFGTEAYYDGTTYGVWSVIDLEGKKWKFMSDGSIYTQRKVYGRIVDAGGEYSTEMVSPKLSYDEMGKLQEVVRCLRQHGGFVNESCGQHVHVDASNHTPQSLKNALTIMYAKEDILFKALKVQERRANSYCQRVRPEVLEKIRKIPNKSITMDRVRNVWYGGRDGSHTHYDHTRYYALNLHAVFSKGTLEWRCFESTLHAGKVRANITLALAISAQAISGILCLIFIIRKMKLLWLKKENRTIKGDAVKELLAMGMPTGLQFSITAIGSMVMQSANNGLGSTYVSAFTAAMNFSGSFSSTSISKTSIPA